VAQKIKRDGRGGIQDGSAEVAKASGGLLNTRQVRILRALSRGQRMGVLALAKAVHQPVKDSNPPWKWRRQVKSLVDAGYLVEEDTGIVKGWSGRMVYRVSPLGLRTLNSAASAAS
jgi:hypothetical protein